jgi:hypothetical protein
MSRQKHLSTYYSDLGEGKAEIWFDFKEELAFIKYLDDNDVMFFEESFPNNSISYVEDAAENWALGIKKLKGYKQIALL